MTAIAFAALLQASTADPVDFVRDVQPLLRTHCLRCHDAKKARGGLRLDARGPAMKGGLSGPAIVPGKAAESPLVRLLLEADEDARMPQKAPPLEPGALDVLRRWVDAGAPWPDAAAGDADAARHWAYVKPVRPPVPSVRGPVRSPIDAFVQARLEREGLAFSPEAPRETLLRRLSLDLTGLPPTPEEVDAFAADRSPDAVERAVDRLLASPHYGEHRARGWLDLARYADTNGFNFDNPRSNWRWRDWVVDAFNRDLPFDRFTVEQIAGDLLPGATTDQRVATGFHRNTMLNEEGGVDREEARWETLVDRVNTTAAVWLGATLACAQCHTHKYDPFSQKEYYRFLAFFDRSDEKALDLGTAEERARRDALRRDVAALERDLKKPPPGFDAKAARERLAALKKAQKELPATTTLVFEERPGGGPPTTLFRIKGGYASPGERVEAGVPASLHPWRAEWPVDRLGLARWLVDRENPLVARVTVNRLWAELFGRPIVETAEDFGTQAEPPSHPELLDWLAVEFMDRGWSVKSLIREIVLSTAYRQSSRVSAALAGEDPRNVLLARGPRFRLDAEAIRDVSLSAAGLLSKKLGGPGVFPLQADTSGRIATNKVDTSWAPSAGEDRHRRGLYTYWRRTALYAAFATFDAPTREFCTVRRPRTNTPLQALSGLNDPSFFDAARGLAKRMASAGDVRSGVILGFRLCTSRTPSEEEAGILAAAWAREREAFAADPAAAKAVAGTPELAAWTLAANVLLNLDETLTKE